MTEVTPHPLKTQGFHHFFILLFYDHPANAVLFFAEKSLAEFYPQGVCGIRKAAELLTAAQAPRTAQIN